METGTSVVSIISIDKKTPDIERHYSEETFYSDSSEGPRSKCKSAAHLLQRKKQQLRPILGSSNPYRITSNYGSRMVSLGSPAKGNMNTFTQKVISAKVLRCKQLQNELTEAHFHLNELVTENRLLKTLQKRQDLALKRYEGTQAELPTLMRSHTEEVRTLKAKLKQVKAQWRDTEQQLKARESDLQALREQHRHLVKLSKDRHLGERESLQQQVEQLQDVAQETDEKVQMLTRKVMLEGKNYKHQLTLEMSRHKESRKQLASALEKIAQLQDLVEAKEKYITSNLQRSYGHQSLSLVSLGTVSRFRGFQNRIKSEVEINPQKKQGCVMEEEEGEGGKDEEHENEGEDDQDYYNDQEEEEEEEEEQQDGSECTYTEAHTSTSQQLSTSVSFENMKETDEKLPEVTEQGTALDFQAKRFQFSNRLGNLANNVEESSSGPTPEDNTSSQRSSCATATGKPKVSSRRGSFQAEMERLPEIARRSKTPSQRGCFQADKTSGSRRGSLKKNTVLEFESIVSKDQEVMDSSKEPVKVSVQDTMKEKELGFMNTLMNEMQNENRSIRRGSLRSELAFDNSSLSMVANNLNRRGSLNNEIRTFNDETELSGVLKGGRQRRESLKDEDALHKHGKREGGLQRLDDITRSWSELQEKIKVETDWAKAMMDKYNSDMKDTELHATSPENFNKKHLLATLKAIDRQVDSVTQGKSSKAEGNGVSYKGTASAHNYSFSPAVEKLHRGMPTHEVTVPVIDRMRHQNQAESSHYWEEERSSTSQFSTRSEVRPKSKAELMKELFGGQSVGKGDGNFVLDPLIISPPDSNSDAVGQIPSARSRIQQNWNAN